MPNRCHVEDDDEAHGIERIKRKFSARMVEYVELNEKRTHTHQS